MNGSQLERELRALSEGLEIPETPDIASSVAARIEERRLHPQWIRPAFVVVATLAVLILLASAVLIFSPDARSAVANLLGVRGVGVQLRDPEVSPSPNQGIEDLGLGDSSSLEEVRQEAGFNVALPDTLGSPTAVLFRESPPGGMVTMVYATRPGLPETNVRGVGLLMIQFKGDFQSPVFRKSAGSGTQITEVLIDQRPGLWIEGVPHLLTFHDRDGDPVEERPRLAGNVLLWERSGVTFRIEAEISLEEAIRIAESVR